MNGQILKELRKKKGLSQKEMAKILGASKTGYVNWELGDYDPKVSVVIKMAKFFGVTIGYLIGEPTNQLTQEDKEELKKVAKIIEEKLK
jgi:Predicted transcriptional regulators